jgi:hypothetical protein
MIENDSIIQQVFEKITKPAILISRDDFKSNPSIVPADCGVYAWFFRSFPSSWIESAHGNHDATTVMYIGISPDRSASNSNLRKRIRQHFTSNASGSTLRLTLGLLLYESGISSFPLRRVGDGRRKTFTHEGEQFLDMWMTRNAFVTWVPHSKPWDIEGDLISKIAPPLNIQNNSFSAISRKISELRKVSSLRANQLPIVDQSGGKRGS